MQVTGKNLKRLHAALDWAIAEVHNQIATCPDVSLFEADLEELETEKAALQKFLSRVERALAKEKR